MSPPALRPAVPLVHCRADCGRRGKNLYIIQRRQALNHDSSRVGGVVSKICLSYPVFSRREQDNGRQKTNSTRYQCRRLNPFSCRTRLRFKPRFYERVFKTGCICSPLECQMSSATPTAAAAAAAYGNESHDSHIFSPIVLRFCTSTLLVA